jgi:DNA-binding MarR family transcriptional regulator
VAVLGFLLSWLIPERPLRQTVAAASATGELGEAFAMPMDAGSEGYVLRGLAALANRDVQRRHIEQICARAGVDLAPLAASLLVRIDADRNADAESLGRRRGDEPEQIRAALGELRGRGLIVEVAGDRRAQWQLTPTGCETLAKLVAARRAHLAELFAEWGPARKEELAVVLRRLADELVPEVGKKAPA